MGNTIGLKYDKKVLKQYINRFPHARIVVVGDIIMDEYIWGDVSRISPEAPVPIVEVGDETQMLGGAANVVHNIACLGAKPVLCGVVGNDHTGKEIKQNIKTLGFDTEGIVTDRNRPTAIKTRIVARNQQVVRYDRESRGEIIPENRKKILGFIKKNLDQIDGIVVSDYGKGVVSADLMQGLRALVADADMMIAVDPKTGNFQHYREVDIITPNHHEAALFCGFSIVDQKTLNRAGRYMLDHLNCRSVLITQGKAGMTLFENQGAVTHIPTVAKQVFDVTGAGDTVISTISLGRVAGLDPRSAAILSNFAAGIVVGKLGTSVVHAEELKNAV